VEDFRVQYKNIFLTYSQISKESTREEFLKNIELKVKVWGLQKYVVSFEKHKDGNLHCHAVIVLKKKPDIKNPRHFDLVCGGVVYHPNIKLARPLDEKAVYIVKEDKEPLVSGFNLEKLKKDVFNKKTYEKLIITLVEIQKDKGFHAALDYFEKNASSLVLGQFTGKVTKALKAIESLKNRRELVPSKYPSSSFLRLDSLEKYLSLVGTGNHEFCYYLSGEPGAGKTEKVISDLNSAGLSFIHAKGVEDLREKILEDTIIVLDDSGLGSEEGKSRNALVKFLECNRKTLLPCRFNDISVPAGSPRIVISNQTFYSLLKSKGLLHDLALTRRVMETYVPGPLYNNLTIVNNVNVSGDANNLTINTNPFAVEQSSISEKIIGKSEPIQVDDLDSRIVGG